MMKVVNHITGAKTKTGAVGRHLYFFILPLFLGNKQYLLVSVLASRIHMLIFSFSLHPAGSSQDRRQRTHKPEGSRSGWVSSTVQDQKAHATHQTHESLLRETGGHDTVIVQLNNHCLIMNTQNDIAGLCPEPVVKTGGHRAIAGLDLSKNLENMQIFYFPYQVEAFESFPVHSTTC